ncbi:MAG: VOC family protein [Gemmatimonadales bacterium]|nr:VOC family protein [Gemmatimonadales bacterium]
MAARIAVSVRAARDARPLVRLLAPLLALIASVPGAASAGAQVGAACRAGADAPRLDHAVVAVADLEAGSAAFRAIGFRTKEGTQHADGLRNRHIKFADGTGIELMSLTGAPTSAIAQGYADRLASGEGGAYAALWVAGPEALDGVARRVGTAEAAPTRSRSGPWQFLSFATSPALDAVFVGAGPLSVRGADSVLAHENGAASLTAAWVEAGPGFESLLRRMGARACGTLQLPDGRDGYRWGLARGSLVVAPLAPGAARARLIGVELARRPGGADAVTPPWEPLKGFWVVIR